MPVSITLADRDRTEHRMIRTQTNAMTEALASTGIQIM